MFLAVGTDPIFGLTPMEIVLGVVVIAIGFWLVKKLLSL